MIITIDGPSGSGKTTIAKRVAEKLGITYFDTGAMYRCVTWDLLAQKIPLTDHKKMAEFMKSFSFEIRMHDGQKRYYVRNQDVTDEIRSQTINEAVSQVSALSFVRKALWKKQREFAENQSAVFEGRDLGSVVFPKAEVKIFLEADPKVRAQRRLTEMRQMHPEEVHHFDEKKMTEDLLRRDQYDSSRKLAPLRCPKGALRVDTTDLSIDEVVEKILERYQTQVKKLLPGWFHSKKMRLPYRIVLCLADTFFRSLYLLKVYGLEHYTKRAAIIAPNHNSYFDPPIAAVSWPEEVHFLAKQSLFKPFLFGRFIRMMNSHPVQGDVGDISVFKMIIQLLKEGRQIVLFPEGGRMNGQLGPIKPGIGMLVMRSQAAIIPTYIHGAYKVWGRNRKFPKLFGRKLACVFGTPIVWESFQHLEKKQAQEEIAAQLGLALKNLEKWYQDGAKGIPP